MELRTLEERLNNIKALTRRITFSNTEDILYELPNNWFDEWTPGERYHPGRIIVRKAVKYLLIATQPIIASEHVYPEVVSARNIYEPFQGSQGTYRWVYGERVVANVKRIYENITYTNPRPIAKEVNIVTPDKSENWIVYEEIAV